MTCTPRQLGALGSVISYGSATGFSSKSGLFLTDNILVMAARRSYTFSFEQNSGLFTVNRAGIRPLIQVDEYTADELVSRFPTGGFVDRGCAEPLNGSADVNVVNVRVHAVQNDW